MAILPRCVILFSGIVFILAGDEFVSKRKPVEKYEMGKVDMIFTKEQQQQLKIRSAYLNIKKWPNATIPYIFDTNFKSIPSRVAAVKQASQDYEDNTCIRLVPRTHETDYVKFINGEGCYSSVGVTGGEQTISLGNGCDTTRGTPVHEIMHALGFMHEHQRPDRDNYVNLFLNNVIWGTSDNFRKVPLSETNLVGKYDLLSVMHYAKWAFSSNSKDTIEPKNTSYLDYIGQREYFTDCDIAKINILYNCNASYPKTCEK